MHISTFSVASLFQQMQALAGGALGDAGFGDALTGQNLPIGPTSSTGSAALSLAPSSQFASNVLGALISAQENQPQAMAANIISAINPGGNGELSLGQVEQAQTGGASTSNSPQALAIANAFSQLDTNGDGELSQSELATALQSLQASTPFQALGLHHRHHHHFEAQGAPTQTTGATTTATTTASNSTVETAAGVGSPTAASS